MSSSFGLHEITFHPVPDNVLQKLDPLVHVIVGTYQNAGESVARANHVCNLIPGATVVLRLWPDDHQYNQMSPHEWASRYIPFTSENKWYLSINNEPLGGTDETQVIAVRDWEMQVLRLANKSKARIAYGAFSTGTPHHLHYKHLVPLWKEAAALGHRQHVWRPNCYYDPKDPFYKDNHLFRPIVYGWKAAIDAGIDPPFTIYGETGIAHNYNPSEGYKTAGISGRDYARQLIEQNLPVAAAVFCWGPWRNNSYSVDSDPDFIDEIAMLGNAANIVPSFPNANNINWIGTRARSLGTYTNIRSLPTTSGIIVGKLPAKPTDIKINRISKWLNRTESKYWYPIMLPNVKGWVREDVFESNINVSVNAIWTAAQFSKMSVVYNAPYGTAIRGADAGISTTAAFNETYTFGTETWLPVNENNVTGWTLASNVTEIKLERIIMAPYYSHHGIGGHSRSPEAYIACTRMLIGWANLTRGLKDTRRPLLSDLLSFVDLEPGDNVTQNHILSLLETFGVKARVGDKLSASQFHSLIEAGIPFMATLAYDMLPGRQDTSYMGVAPVIVLGYSGQDIVIHDPNWKGSEIMMGSYWKVPRVAFWNAINSLSSPFVIVPQLQESGRIVIT